MRRSSTLALAALLAASVASAAGDPNTPAPVQKTTVRGAAPDLVGRWLVVGIVDAAGTKRVVTVLWDVGRRDGQLDLRVRFARLPEAQQASADGANAKGEGWTPSADDLAAIGKAWDALREYDSLLREVDTTISARDAFDETLSTDAATKDAIWAVTQTRLPRPGTGAMIRQADVYAAREASDGGYAGSYATVVLAAAPLPIPISLKGSFRLYRLPVESPGLLARVLGLFEGCGRR
jgi:hypothetical protein